MQELDILSLSAEDFAALQDWEIQNVLQTIAGHMAVAQAEMRRYSDGFHRYMSAKEDFSRLRQLANVMQTVARTKI